MVSLADRPLRRPQLLWAMAAALAHRGPDGHGVIERPGAGIGCRRLRIVDLHERADQPFCDPAARRCLACNGEIYNAGDLRRRYRDFPYRSRSDVEVLLPHFAARGVAEGIAELDGMFGLAVWDEADRVLTLARDRAGEKPLYYRRRGEEVWFASEIPALLVDESLPRELDEEAIYSYLALGYVPAPRTAFRGIRQLDAGTFARFSAAGEEVVRYWDPRALAAAEAPPGPHLQELRRLLAEAISRQVPSEVPAGIFVSGGVDSALVAAIAARADPERRLYTFNARFAERSYDESHWARECAARFGTEHREVVVDEASLGEALAAVTAKLAEPLADPAILPTYLLTREARPHVKVIMSGEGADELFGGYPTYLGHKLVPRLLALPAPLRRGLRRAVGWLPASHGKVTLEFLLKRFLADAEKPWLERHLAWFGSGAHKLMAAVPQGASILPSIPDHPPGAAGAMLVDYATYLPDDLLVKIDRATMMSSLEARAPFLDRRLSAFALALPEEVKVRGLTTKYLLKEAALEWLPRRAVYRKKRGLSVPVASWVNRGLKAEVDRLLAPERLRRQQLLDPSGVGRLLAEHRAGAANHARPLWTVVILQHWLERWLPQRAG